MKKLFIIICVLSLTKVYGQHTYLLRNVSDTGTNTNSGTVTNFTSGSLSPLFTTSVATATTTPNLSYSLSTAAAYKLFGNNTSSTSAPTYFTPTIASGLFANQGTTTTVLHGNAAGNPSWGSVVLTTDVSGILPKANGGSGTATPAIVAGTNITVSGTWPNQTIAAPSSLIQGSNWLTQDLSFSNDTVRFGKAIYDSADLWMVNSGSIYLQSNNVFSGDATAQMQPVLNSNATNRIDVINLGSYIYTITTSASSESLGANSYYAFTGATTTWTLPTIANNKGVSLILKNKGSGNITLNSNAGGSDIYDTSAVSTLTITPGQCVRLVNDGGTWTVVSKY